MSVLGRMLAVVVVLPALHAPAVLAQDPPRAGAAAPVDRALTAGSPIADSLARETPHGFSLELGAERFVRGSVDQITVDVVVTVQAPDGRTLGRFDGPGRGPERFSFDAEEAGTYRLEVAPLEDETGRYELVLDAVEPIAETPEARVEQLVALLDRPDTPGGVVGVVRHGDLVFTRAFGSANLAYGIPFTPETPTNIGSTSKQFTAFAISLLAEGGKLSLDDDVRTHLPELKDFGETVTLRHLLTHTSGYREFLNLLAMGGRLLDYDHVDPDELVEVVNRQPELQNPPGTEWNYNNTGFALLARVVEVVGGQPFPDWMRDNVFLPLGMEHTVVRADPRTIVPGRAMGYVDGEEGGFKEASDLGGAVGAGGIYTTVGDLATWMGHLGRPRLGSPAIVEAMTTSYVLQDGDSTGYGLGLSIDEYRGLRRVQHGGADIAHRSTFVFFPELDAGFIVLSNYASVPGSIPGGVAEAFFGEEFEPERAAAEDQATPFDPEDFDPETFDAFAGSYEMEEMPGFVLTFRREDDTFYTRATGQPEFEIVPTSDSTFTLLGVEASVTFHRESDGTVERLTLHQNGDHPATRAEESPLSPEQLATYEGRYFSEEIETYYHVVVEDGGLVVRHRRLEDITLTPTDTDAFSGGFPLAVVRFRRNDGGAVTGFTAANGRTRDVLFERVGGPGGG